MLRIPSKKKEEENVEPVVEEQEDVVIEEDMPEAVDVKPIGLVDPSVARYLGPDSRCHNCIHFLEGEGLGSCEVVSGEIDPDGVCSLHTPDVEEVEAESVDSPDVDEEVPSEE